MDRHGAKRQTDVKITRRTRFHQFVTLVECKRWKKPVSRDRIDVLATSIEVLGAHNDAVEWASGRPSQPQFVFLSRAAFLAHRRELYTKRHVPLSEWGAPVLVAQFVSWEVALAS